LKEKEVISISNFQTYKQAKSYYQKENYYQKNSEAGYFHGKGFDFLNLSSLKNSELKKENYEKLLQGINPATNEKLNKADKRAGFDVTFSAPKSLSIVIEFLEATGHENLAKKLRDMHEQAVQKTMQEIENKYAYTRIRDKNTGEIKKVKANGLLYTSFQHDITRKSFTNKIDPQLHTHNFVFNIVTYIDPVTNELKTGTIENFEIFKNKMYLGQLYRTELANNLKELGIQIEVTDSKNGFFELKDFDKKLLNEFSNRSNEIKEKLEEYKEKYPNASESELKNIINADIKIAKGKVDREKLYQENLERLEKIIDKEKFADYLYNLVSNRELNKEEKQAKINEIINLSANLITEYNSTFSKEDILREALKLALASNYPIKKEELEQALNKNENIIQLGDNVYTTQEILKSEKFVIENINNKAFSIVKNPKNYKKIDEFIKTKYNNMTSGQKEFFKQALINKAQFLVVQGDAGTGKTYSLKAINEFVKENKLDKNFELVGLSFTGKASAGLEEESGIKSKTISSFLFSESNKKDKLNKRKRVLVVDEAGLVGSKQMAELFRIAKENGDKIILLGDTKQFKAIQAGNIFSDMQEYSSNLIKLGETLRQKTDLLKNIVKSIKEKNIFEAQLLLEKSNLILEAPKDDLIKKAKDEYFENDENLLIIASKNSDKNAINELIRQQKTFKQEKEFIINELVNLNGAEKYLANSYIGKYIHLGKIKGFDNRFIYKAVAKKNDFILILENEEGKKIELDLRQYADNVTAFETKNKKFGIGDKIIFTKNDNKKGFKNGEIAVIKDIKDNEIILDNGKVINTNEYNYFDWGYAITDYKAQGVTADNVLIVADSNIVSYNAFYTQITRAKYNVKLFVENKERYFAKVENEAFKSSTIKYQNLKGVENDTERNNGKDFTKSDDFVRKDFKFRKQIREFRKIRFRLKKLIDRTKQRLQQLINRNNKFNEREQELER
jgi:conjugative relaxase-like TrwC/TraI family protein